MADVAPFADSLQRLMLENTIDGGVTWSSLWTAAEVYNYINQRLSRFRLESGHHLARTTIAVSALTPTTDLPADLMALRAASWVEAGRDTTALVPLDYHMVDNGGLPTSNGPPYGYILEPEASPLTIRFVPTPLSNGTLTLFYYPEHTVVTSFTTTLPILDMFAPYIACGVLADMFSKEGEANDPDRAKYFEERWDEGIELAKLVQR